MIEPLIQTQTASDGYPIHVLIWPTHEPPKGRVVVLHGVQSHGGWYHGLGRTLAEAGYEAHFPDRRGSGANTRDRGHTPSLRRLLDDVSEWLAGLKEQDGSLPIALAGISWGGKTALVVSGRRPALVDALALICPGLHPRVGVPFRERLAIASAYLTGRRMRRFPIPLSDPALFTANPEGQAFIADDPLSLRTATASLLAASKFLDRRVSRVPTKVHQPALLMLAGHDRIVDNDRTRAAFDRIASTERRLIEYPEGHHTLEFDPDPTRYARDLAAWLDETIGPRQGMPIASPLPSPILSP
ncbi:MAG: alpha/beta fold hydrolase [Isosphaeraceae bacterium]